MPDEPTQDRIRDLRRAVDAAIDAKDDYREIAALQELTRLEPENRHLWIRLACQLRAIGQIESCCTAFARIVAAGWGNARTHSIYGWTLFELKRYAEALRELEISAGMEPRIETTHARGHALYALKRFAEAEAAFREVICGDPRHEEALTHLALVLRFQGKCIHESESLLRKAIAIDPHCPMARRELGYTLSKQNRFDEAMELLEEAIQAEPTDVWARIYMGLCHVLCGRDIEAEQRYLEACAIDPTWSLPWMLCGGFYKQQGELMEAEEMLRKAVTLNPEDWMAAKSLGLVLRAQGDETEAVHWLETARLFCSEAEQLRISELLAPEPE